MLLVMDIGNSNITFGIFDGKKLLQHWRIGTAKNKTSDEYGILIKELFFMNKIDKKSITHIALSSVVPPLLPTMVEMFHKYLNLTPMIIEPGIKTGMPILYDNPRDVGADRIVNGVAAFEKYKGPVIVIDFGTATTFDAVSQKGEYLGGVIAPGIVISSEALFHHTAKLPRIEFVKPKEVIGKNTIWSMQSGIIYGYAGLVDSIVIRMKKEMGCIPSVIATGGLAEIISSASETIEKVDPFLTLEGLRIIFEKNRT
jgi:type III pantothenate kinase